MSEQMSLAGLNDKLTHCSRCNVCKWSPAVKDERFATICPSFNYGKAFAYTGGGRVIGGYALLHGRLPEDQALTDTVYACSMCGGCDTACKTNFGRYVEPLDSLYAIRRRMVERGRHPDVLKALLENLRDAGNVHGKPASARADWIRAAGLERLIGRQAPVLVHIGDAAFDPAAWPGIVSALHRMETAGLDITVGGEKEPDCGGLAFDIGDQPLAADLARRTSAWIAGSGARTVITLSDGAFAAFRGIYPRLDPSIDGVDIQHVSQWLAQAPIAPVAAASVTYHDTCKLGRLSDPYTGHEGEGEYVLNAMLVYSGDQPLRSGAGGVYDAPREVLRKAGADLIEMKRTREYAFCCGAGGGGDIANPEFARSAASARLDEAAATGAEVLVTSCQGCAEHLAGVAAAEGRSIRVVSLLDYVADDSGVTAQKPEKAAR